MVRQNDLDELAAMISSAIKKASQLKIDVAAYILSMALVEVTKVTRGVHDEPNGSNKQ